MQQKTADFAVCTGIQGSRYIFIIYSAFCFVIILTFFSWLVPGALNGGKIILHLSSVNKVLYHFNILCTIVCPYYYKYTKQIYNYIYIYKYSFSITMMISFILLNNLNFSCCIGFPHAHTSTRKCPVNYHS